MAKVKFWENSVTGKGFTLDAPAGGEKAVVKLVRANFPALGDFAVTKVGVDYLVKPLGASTITPVTASHTLCCGNGTQETCCVHNTKNGGESKMNFGKFFKGLDFGALKDNRFRMSLLGPACLNKEGSYVTYDPVQGKLIDVVDFVFDAGKALFKIPVQYPAAGDTILFSGNPVYVTSTDDAKIVGVSLTDGTESTIIPQGSLLGVNFYTKIVSLFGNLLSANGAGPAGLDPAKLMPMMVMGEMFGEGKKDKGSMMETMMMLQVMGGANIFGGPGTNTGFNMQALMPFMLMQDGGIGSGGDSMEMMLMMSLMGAGNPFAAMFGQAGAAPTVEAPVLDKK